MRGILGRVTAHLALWLVIAGIVVPALGAGLRLGNARADDWLVICRTGTADPDGDQGQSGSNIGLAEHCPFCRLPACLPLLPPQTPVTLASYGGAVSYPLLSDPPARFAQRLAAHRSRAPPTLL